MSNLIIPTQEVWTRQPQLAAKIDYSHPAIVGNNVLAAYVAPFSVDTKIGTVSSNSNACGVASYCSGSGNRIDLGKNCSPSTRNCTVIAVFRVRSLSVVSPIYTSHSASYYNGIRLNVSTTGAIELTSGDGAGTGPTNRRTLATVAGVVAVDKCYRVVAGFTSPTTGYIYVNGVEQALTASGTASGYAVGTGNANIHAFYYTSAWNYGNQEVNAVIALDKVIPASLAASVSSNPWQVLKPEDEFAFASILSGGSSTDLAISEAIHSHYADSLLLSWQDLLTVADSTHGHTADNLTLSTQWLLAVQEALHAHAADNIGLSATGSASLSVQDSTHAHLADALTLVTTWLLSVADSTHGHAADSLALDTSNATWLTVQEALHAHSADSVALTLNTWLAIVDAAHAHYADAQTITVDASLAVAEALHAVYSESVRLGIPGLYVRAPNGPGYRRLMINVTRPKQRNTVRH